MTTSTFEGGRLQIHAYRILRARVYECLNGYQINPTTWSLIGLIYQSKDGIRPGGAAKLLAVKPALITNIVSNLTDRKLVKSIDNASDGRAKLLMIDGEGKKFVKKVEQDLAKHLEVLLKDIDNKDLEAYHRVLRQIIANEAIK